MVKTAQQFLGYDMLKNSKTAGAHIFVMGKVIANLPELKLDNLSQDNIHGMFVKLNDITPLRDDNLRYFRFLGSCAPKRKYNHNIDGFGKSMNIF